MNVYILEVARNLASRGIIVDVFTRCYSEQLPATQQICPGARVVYIHAGPFDSQKDALYDFIPEFVRNFKIFVAREDKRYDVLYAHYWLSGVAGIELSDFLDSPLVFSFHTIYKAKRLSRPGETDVPARSKEERRIARLSDVTIVWTAEEKDAVIRYCEADPDRVKVVPPGIDVSLFRPLDTYESDLDDKSPLILYVGRLEFLKGVHILPDTVASLEHCGARLKIVGGEPGSYKFELIRRRIEELNLADKVQLMGSVPRALLPSYYAAASVCIVPSYYESFGFVALEAAACGRPVVGFKTAGLSAIISDGKTGYLTSMHCAQSLAEKIDLLLYNRQLRLRMGEAARRHSELFDWGTSIKGLIETFERVIRSYRLRGGLRRIASPSM